jgi:hypothetical protein
VLSQDDQLRLAAIAAHIRAEDAMFADALSRGKPQCPRGDRRWPFQLILIAGGLMTIYGLGHALLGLIVVGAVVTTVGWRADRLRRVNRHRAPRANPA